VKKTTVKQITRVILAVMVLEDIPRVREIEQQSFRTMWPREAYTHELRDNRLAAYMVARLDREIVGYAGMWVIMDEAHITTIAVDPLHRGQHIGERLLVGLIDDALERGARWMTLEVRKSNTGAQALYHKYGFREIGIRKGYYSDNREDAIVMWTGNLRELDFQRRYAELKKTFEE
jgi:ribosomal-protein-alanine N-acetyltransferase